MRRTCDIFFILLKYKKRKALFSLVKENKGKYKCILMDFRRCSDDFRTLTNVSEDVSTILDVPEDVQRFPKIPRVASPRDFDS